MMYSIRLKVIGLTFGVILLVGGSIFLVSRYVGRQDMLQTFAHNGQAIAFMISKDAIDPLYQLNVRELRHQLEHARLLPDVSYVYVTDAAGVVLSDGTRENLLSDQRLTDAFSLDVQHADGWISRIENEYLKIGGPIFLVANGSPIGYLQVGFALAGAYNLVHRTTRTGIYLTLVCLGLGTILAIIFATTLSRPIVTIARAAGKIGAGELDTHLYLRRRDELGVLAAAINQMTSNLRETTVSKRFVDKVLHSMADMLVVLGPDLTITTVNDAVVHILGYAPDELVDAPFRVICQDADLRLFASVAGPVETTFHAKDQRDIPVSFSHSRMEGDTGLLQGVVCLAQDNTERQRTAEALHKSYDALERRVQERTADLAAANASLQSEISERQRLEDELLNIRKLEAIGVLAGGIAHDFNNFLTAIMGNISLAKMSTHLPEKSLSRLTEAEKACERARDLTYQLLTFSKGGEPIRQSIAIAELVKESASFTLRGSNVRCVYAIPDDLWSAEVDEGQISQVISNIMINAGHAMPDGGVVHVQADNVTINAEHRLPVCPGKYVKVSITDQGIGISEEYLPKIFDPYFTTKSLGSGLGLATAYAIMQKHDGYIAAESALGMGTTFTLYLPASEEGVLPVQDAVERPQVGTGKILVMDDEEAIRDLVDHLLIQLGYDVESACDGVEAIALYTKAKEAGQPFDAVIMDLTIPGSMGGKEAIKHFLDIDSQVKTIVSSGYSTDPIMADFRHYGFSDVVAKPYKLTELSYVLHRVLAGEGVLGN